jgi:2-oxoglutarate ferredoxin oxidoreductase subunit beta
MQKSYKLGSDYQANNKVRALEKALEFNEEKFPLGIIYKEDKPAYHEQLPQLAESTLVSQSKKKDLNVLFNDFI